MTMKGPIPQSPVERAALTKAEIARLVHQPSIARRSDACGDGFTWSVPTWALPS